MNHCLSLRITWKVCLACLLVTSTAQAGELAETYEAMQENGYSFTGNVTQFGFGVVGGGNDSLPDSLLYSGHGDYLLNVDASKFGLQDGLFFRLRAEHRFGEQLDPANTGSVMPPTIASHLPAETENLYITNLVVTQALSENFALFMGKFDTLDGDRNDFAHGRGVSQFSNLALVTNPAAIVGSPYSSLGAGFAILHDYEPLFVFTIMNPTDTTRTSGFDELFNNGALLTAGLRVPTNFFGKRGHQSFTALYSTQYFSELVPDPRATISKSGKPVTVTLTNKQEGTYAFLYNFDQYLYSDRQGRGFGLFGRVGVGDQSVNPLRLFLSAGIGGHNMLSRSRRNDSFGAGYYYLDATKDASLLTDIATATSEGLRDGQGLELYYNFNICSFMDLTFDYQLIGSASDSSYFEDPTSILGARLNIRL
ncbi:Carbohydrate-selective porin, OprB family [Rosistilla ulvae]|uniref:Carbohydrate-selective porin, OprB family n=1 Tax=Rosistilla ulvae TaxID=1930277 RepID=A0A517LVT8_9BACT|nr:Carbohydrate-selective porin, OprB family [Rosistilla ulvae]